MEAINMGMFTTDPYFYYFFKPYSKKHKDRIKNDLAYRLIFNNLYNVALNQYRWENLPAGLTSIILEDLLMKNSQILIAKHPKYDNIACQIQRIDARNIYNQPTKVAGITINGEEVKPKALYVENANNDNCDAFIARDNPQAIPFIWYIMYFSYQLADLFNAMGVAVKKIKNPQIFKGNTSNIRDIEEYYNNLEANDSIILATKSMTDELSPVEAIQTPMDHAALKSLKDQYEWLQAQILGIMGINGNSQPDKSERLIVAEATANDEFVMQLKSVREEQRKRLKTLWNEIFGQNVNYDTMEIPEVQQGREGEISSDTKQPRNTSDNKQ